MVSPVPLRAAAATRPANVAMSAVVDEVMDKLKAMTLLEASELVKAIEETFDVDASAGGARGGGEDRVRPGPRVLPGGQEDRCAEGCARYYGPWPQGGQGVRRGGAEGDQGGRADVGC